ncbi:BTB/POZ protein [Xylariaceae sp. FL0662B]|nr:BTB/POZ protein [Xylariaceae sp. FL0662B]
MEGRVKNNIFSEGDEELLASGLFSDVKVICGDQTWSLHRSVICPRCSYFAKAFTGHFMEAKTREITIREQDPVGVNWIIAFIYTGKASPDLEALLGDPNSIFGTCMSALEISDFFGLDSFHTFIVSALEKQLLKSAKTMQASVINQNRKEDFKQPKPTFINGFFAMAGLVYSRESLKPLREVLVNYIALTRFLVLEVGSFRDTMDTVPGLASDVLKKIVQGVGSSSQRLMITDQFPSTCVSCRKKRNFYPVTWFNYSKVGQFNQPATLRIKGFCESCSKKHDPKLFT